MVKTSIVVVTFTNLLKVYKSTFVCEINIDMNHIINSYAS